jgi:hypothetical protein
MIMALQQKLDPIRKEEGGQTGVFYIYFIGFIKFKYY